MGLVPKNVARPSTKKIMTKRERESMLQHKFKKVLSPATFSERKDNVRIFWAIAFIVGIICLALNYTKPFGPSASLDEIQHCLDTTRHTRFECEYGLQ